MTAKIGNGIRIKAQLDTSEQRIVLMVDQPVLKGYSFWCAQRSKAEKYSPLSNALFEQANPTSILIHEMNVTVTGTTVNKDTAQRLGQIIRSHLEAGKAVMDEAYLAAMPSEEQVREGLQEVIDNEINPGIAAHSGTITLTAVKGIPLISRWAAAVRAARHQALPCGKAWKPPSAMPCRNSAHCSMKPTTQRETIPSSPICLRA